MNKPIHLGLSMLDISKTPMYEFWYDYMEPKYGEKTKLLYMDTDGVIALITTENIYVYITKEFETRFHTSNYESDYYQEEKFFKKIGLIRWKNKEKVCCIESKNL